MSRVARTEWYRRVNEAWPKPLPPLSEPEAIAAARKLYRYVGGETWDGPVHVATGNRYSGWFERRRQLDGSTIEELVVNPSKGWPDLVHGLSHWFSRAHGGDHARLELRMIKEVVHRGWLDGKLRKDPKPPAPKPSARDLREQKILRICARIVAWERKLARSERALAKLRRQARALQRVQTREASVVRSTVVYLASRDKEEK